MEVELKKWEMKYVDELAKHANNKKISDNVRDTFPYPYTKDDAIKFIKGCIESDEDKNLQRAIIVDGSFAGGIGVHLQSDVHCKSAEIGYWLSETYWGKGIMSEAVKEMCRQAFERYDIVRIYAKAFRYNQGSQKVLEKAGFKLEGILEKSVYKNGKIFDSCVYALINKEWEE